MRGGSVAGSAGLEGAGDGEGLGGLDDAGVCVGRAGAVDEGGLVRCDGGAVRRRSRVAGGRGLASRRGGRGRSVAAGGARGHDAGRCGNAAVLGDAELRGPLVLAGHVVDQLQTVALGTIRGGEVSRGGPAEETAVGETFSEGGAVLDDVGGGALDEEDGDGVGRGGRPLDVEGLASRDELGWVLASGGCFVWFHSACSAMLEFCAVCAREKTYLVQIRTADGVARGLANRRVHLRSRKAGEKGCDGDLGEHVDGRMGN